jgi:hypothetical protein
MSGGHHPRGAVEHGAEVIPASKLGLPSRQSHPNRQLERPLRFDRGVDRGFRRRERRHDAVAGVAEQEAPVLLDDCA